MRFKKICERYIAEREADCRDGIAAPELDQPIVAGHHRKRDAGFVGFVSKTSKTMPV